MVSTLIFNLTARKAVQNHLIFQFYVQFLIFLCFLVLFQPKFWKKSEESLNFQFKVKAFVKQVAYKLISKQIESLAHTRS